MSRKDVVKICLQNLFRRKMRTLLTVLGVVVGCCSIVIMVSIGIGMKRSQEQMLSEMGDLSIITITAPRNTKQSAKLNKNMLKTLKELPGVEALSPKVSLGELPLKIYAGSDKRFVLDSPTVVGMDVEALDKLGYKLEGLQKGKEKSGALGGEYFEFGFQDSLRPEGRNLVDRYQAMDEEGFGREDESASAQQKKSSLKPYFNPTNTPLSLEIEVSEGKKMSFPLHLIGKTKENFGKGFETSEGLILPLSEVEALKKAAGVKQSKDQSYETVVLKAKSIEEVASLEKSIKALGLQTFSMESLRKPLEKEARQKQMMLGGLGGISLFVAAIGITNTMIMSITERTKEIGIMKALGCYVKDIRKIFLAEAGAIGLLGGLLGCVISLIISFGMNWAAARGGLQGLGESYSSQTSAMSVIPFWLLLFATLFSLAIGLGSGYYPANKAVKISALEAIKNE